VTSSAVVAALLLAPLAATFGSPTVEVVLPRGGQRGSEITLFLHGDRLADAAEVMFLEPGFTVVSLEANDEKKVTVKLQIAADAALGEHRLRLRTRTGLSELRTFWVGPFPCVQE
jgi:hypothetical protein